MEKWYEHVDELAAEGLLTHNAILNTLSERTFRIGCRHEKTHSLHSYPFSISGFLPPSLRDAGALVYCSLLYLSQYPFYLPIPDALTNEGPMRALAWAMPGRSKLSMMKATTPFQSFATTRDGKSILFDAVHAKEHSFRPVGRKLVGDERELVHHLSIPQDKFQAVVKLLVTTYFGKPKVPVEHLADLDHAVDCIVCPVIQRPGIRKVATLPVLAQMNSVGVFSWYCVCIKPPKTYDVSDATVKASVLGDDLDALPAAAIALLVLGRSLQTGEKLVEQKLLFQLSPIQHALRGNTTRPGREIDGDELQVEVEVEDIEMWTEQQPEYDYEEGKKEERFGV
ncbi:uncharacterized protein EURHEDRAFT_518396 [Aspergillus ruber CBS 135680]|uniref:Uncharacterized protein n=1 Tax=Aspergillus ruber (strain CBS 135680) TaxID=1388766 RepID=A0A017S330_ASPRC|nr:uncharacterized protein EURHEDRAFT_518396 [Aspergillus ruber CBS 135680]EYE91372.1 hypothetical protein EURHEDRAFT_518396 [Aspergillus ruber CBS 135680]